MSGQFEHVFHRNNTFNKYFYICNRFVKRRRVAKSFHYKLDRAVCRSLHIFSECFNNGSQKNNIFTNIIFDMNNERNE